MKILFQIVLLFWPIWTFAQEKMYVLTNRAENAHINYKVFQASNDFEKYKNDGLKKKAFEPVDYEFTTYIFISEYVELSLQGTEKSFYDYLILKVGPETNKIIGDSTSNFTKITV